MSVSESVSVSVSECLYVCQIFEGPGECGVHVKLQALVYDILRKAILGVSVRACMCCLCVSVSAGVGRG